MIAIIGAMDEEVAMLKEKMTEVQLSLIHISLARPVLKFRLQNGDKEQQELFFQAVNQGLADMAENGIADELYHAVIKENLSLIHI